MPLFPAEEAAIAKAVRKRRIEYAAGRHSARLAMERLGHTATAIPSGVDRMPIWPKGLVGSITHSANWCAAVVAPSEIYRAIGIDMEPVGAVAPDLASTILRADEVREINQATCSDHIDWITLYFCLKEAAYKVFYPIWRQVIDFHQMRIFLHPNRQSFSAIPHVNGFLDAQTFCGKYSIGQGRVHAACWKNWPIGDKPLESGPPNRTLYAEVCSPSESRLPHRGC
jgi:4'-phosphopantetheinyl transferase EntD